MYAVIRTDGKQYRVAEGDIVELEKLDGEAGAPVTFDEVLLLGDEGATELGRPLVAGAAVTGEILAQFKGRKVIVFKIKRRKNYRRKKGHRQEMTRVRVTGISATGTSSGADVAPPLPPAALGG
jgi:large subunit ribosomal protein L21